MTAHTTRKRGRKAKAVTLARKYQRAQKRRAYALLDSAGRVIA